MASLLHTGPRRLASAGGPAPITCVPGPLLGRWGQRDSSRCSGIATDATGPTPAIHVDPAPVGPSLLRPRAAMPVPSSALPRPLAPRPRPGYSRGDPRPPEVQAMRRPRFPLWAMMAAVAVAAVAMGLLRFSPPIAASL